MKVYYPALRRLFYQNGITERTIGIVGPTGMP